MANYIFSFTFDSKKPRQIKGVMHNTIYLRLIKGRTKKKKSSKVVVPTHIWSEDKQAIKDKFQAKYSEDHKRLLDIQNDIPVVRAELVKGTLTGHNALRRLLGAVRTQDCKEFIETLKPTAKRSANTLRKHRSNLNAMLNKHLKSHKEYCNLDFTHLADMDCVEEIANILFRSGISGNSRASYLKTLNMLTKEFKSPIINPFSVGEHIPTEEPAGQPPVSKNELIRSFKNINSIKQFECWLFWMYSFCLLGLDGVDICNIDENKICEGKLDNILDYYPENDNERYKQKIHAQLQRQKVKNSRIIVQINLFPTLLIRDMLHYCIKITRPEIAYTGDDRLRIFNFYTKNSNGEPVTDGMDKWILQRGYYSDILSSKLGATIQQTRHTVSHIGSQTGVSQDKIDLMLNHKLKGSIRHYLTKDQVEQDIFQIHIFQNYGIIEALKLLFKLLDIKTEVINNIQTPYINNWVFSDEYKIGNRKVNYNIRRDWLNRDKLTSFEYSEEKKLQFFLEQNADIKFKVNSYGELVEEKLDEKNYPKEIKELLEKRRKLAYPEIEDKKVDVSDLTFEKTNETD